MHSLSEKIREDMKDAMRAKDAVRLGTIRLLMAAIKKHEIDTQTTLDDAGVLKFIQKQIKQRQDSITQFNAAGRTELAEKEQLELAVLEAYLPAQLDEAQISALIREAIKQTGAQSMKDMGKVMSLLKPQLEGQADMAHVSALIKTLLT